uniref:Allatotropin receptor 1 n=2 Tax=Platynereis dumerilii TaxID=6359 RepID=A0A0K0PVS5_PLADU|nr:allatotropin receptor 1 [Platynereis dumerilii]
MAVRNYSVDNPSVLEIDAMHPAYEDGDFGITETPPNATNCRNEYCVSDEEYLDMIKAYVFPSRFEWVLIVLYIQVFTIGLCGNLLVCFAVWRNQHMRTVTNYFIVNLAVADLLVIIICLPPTVLVDVSETWYMGAVMCKVVHYMQGVSVSVSVLTLSCISVERWYAICHPLTFRSTTTRVRSIIVVTWVVALVILIPELIVLDTSSKYENLTILLTVCRPTMLPFYNPMAYELFKMVALYFLPIILMSVTYGNIVICLWSNAIPCEPTTASSRPLHNNSRTTAEAQLIARRKAAKMLIAVVVMFGVCYLPVHLTNILRYAKLLPESENITFFPLVAHWLCYFNSAINPVIYNFMSEKFQKAFRNTLFCCSSPCMEGKCCNVCNSKSDKPAQPACV